MKRFSPLIAIGFLIAVIWVTPVRLRSNEFSTGMTGKARLMAQTAPGATAAASDSVRLETGQVSGTSGTSGEIRAFKGIPFAAPPVGALRWRAPQPAARWDGVRKADQFGPAACREVGRRTADERRLACP